MRPRLRTIADIDTVLALYRELGDLAPLAIDADWDALVLNYETASTVVPADPASVQRAVARVVRQPNDPPSRARLAARQLRRRHRPSGDDRARRTPAGEADYDHRWRLTRA